MDYEAWVRYGLVIDAASGVVFVLLGLAVAFLARGAPPEKRGVVRAFVAFSVVWGLNLIFRNLARDEIGDPLPFGAELSLATNLVQGPLAVWFALAFPRALRRDEWRLVILPAVVGVVTGATQLGFGPITPGRMLLVVYATEVFCFSFLLILLAQRFAAAPPREERLRRDARTATIAFIPYWATAAGAVVLTGAPHGWAVQVGTFAGLAATYIVAALWLRASEPKLALAFFAGPLAGAVLAVATDPRYVLDVGYAGISRLFAVAVLAYAILRHQLLGLDVKVRWTLAKSTMAGIFLVVFFVASEAAQALFSERWGTAIGIGAAAALLFALAPIQHFAERLATAAVPTHGALPAGAGVPEREESYRFALREALRDGDLTKHEERSLANLATHLGIPAARAYELREAMDAERAPGPPSRRRRR